MTEPAENRTELMEGSTCPYCKRGKMWWNDYCRAYVCDNCMFHHGLIKCRFCGWGGVLQSEEKGAKE